MRRNSEEELYLLRTHDMEEGSSHSDLSTSGEHQTEEVTTVKLHCQFSVFMGLCHVLNFWFSCYSLTLQMSSCIKPFIQ